MGIKSWLYITTFLSVFSLYGKGTEEQRKYVSNDSTVLQNFITNSADLDGFKTYYHSAYTYYDLYLDTPDFLLYQNNFSLRLRKRNFDDGTVGYGFQLKSEMLRYGAIRLEVEEKELDFYKLPYKKEWIKLSDLLDIIFDFMPDLEEVQKIDTAQYELSMAALKNWIIMKAGAPIAPFQKLRFLHPEIFTISVIEQLEPVLIGKSLRQRIHVYIDLNDPNKIREDLPANPIPIAELPPFFVGDNSRLWVMESSLDDALFYAIKEQEFLPFEVREYEVENKYRVPELSAELMNAFDQQLVERMGLIPELASKYKQCVDRF